MASAAFRLETPPTSVNSAVLFVPALIATPVSSTVILPCFTLTFVFVTKLPVSTMTIPEMGTCPSSSTLTVAGTVCPGSLNRSPPKSATRAAVSILPVLSSRIQSPP